MKLLGWKILIACCFLSNLNFAQDNAYNSIVYQCVKESFSERGVNLEAELTKFEDHLISSNQFVTINGQSLYNYIKEISTRGTVEFFVGNYDDWSELRKVSPFDLYSEECRERLQTVKLENRKPSKLELLNDEFKQIVSVTPQSVATIITNVLSPSDFDTEPFKTMVLLMILNTQKSIAYKAKSKNRELKVPKD